METKFYDLSEGSMSWSANLLASNAASELVEVMKGPNPAFWEKPQPLEFLLLGSRTDDPSTEELDELGHDGFFKKYPYGKLYVEVKESNWRNILLWQSMGFTEHPIMPYPDNCYRIVSPKVKSIFEQFKVGEHRYYPIKVRHEITGEVRDYFLLHMSYYFNNFRELLYWPSIKTSYLKKDKKKKSIEIIKDYERGFFKSYEEFIKEIQHLSTIYNPEKKITTPYRPRIEEYIYTQDWDIFEYRGTILINEKVRQTLIKELGVDHGVDTGNLRVATGYTPGDPLPEWE